jgi:hypothetical protein
MHSLPSKKNRDSPFVCSLGLAPIQYPVSSLSHDPVVNLALQKIYGKAVQNLTKFSTVRRLILRRDFSVNSVQSCFALVTFI